GRWERRVYGGRRTPAAPPLRVALYGPASMGSSPPRRVARGQARLRPLLGGRFPRRHPPHFVGQPLEPLLGVLELRGRHLLSAPRDLARVHEQLVQHLAQRSVGAPLRLAARAHAVWIPSARSSALRNSCAAARSVEARPRSAR